MRYRRAARLGGLILALSAGSLGASIGIPSSVFADGAPSDVSTHSFNSRFTTMTQFKALASSGNGIIAAILPDTVSSTRYVEFDEPDITKALTTAGLKPSQFVVQNALGSDATELTDAQIDISKGAKVLILDPLDSGVGTQIEAYAQQRGVKVIDYDQLTLGGSHTYFVGFNDVKVGKMMGQGLVTCVARWHLSKPHVIVMQGAITDNNATLYARGYDSVLNPLFKSGKWTAVARTAGTWDQPTAESEFQTAYAASHNANAALTPNDETAAPIVTYLRSQNVRPKSFPLTGQDATLTGLDNVLAGYQCGTVYKPIYLEAQASVALALYLRAGKIPPKSLLNGTTRDTTKGVNVPSVLMVPTWVTTKNMNATVIKDRFVPVAQLCAGEYESDCRAAGITR